MRRFLIGLVVGVVGYWAYERVWLPIQPSGQAPGEDATILRPTPQEVASRPTEPIPGHTP